MLGARGEFKKIRAESRWQVRSQLGTLFVSFWEANGIVFLWHTDCNHHNGLISTTITGVTRYSSKTYNIMPINSTFSKQGDQWTIENDAPSSPATDAKNSFAELTKDLLMANNDALDSGGAELMSLSNNSNQDSEEHELSFDMSDNDEEETNALETQPPQVANLDEELTAVKEPALEEDEQTVALSVENTEDDPTVALSDHEPPDEATVAMSLAAEDDTSQPGELQDTTIEVPSAASINNENDDDDASENSFDIHFDEEPKEEPKQTTSSANDATDSPKSTEQPTAESHGEAEFEDAPSKASSPVLPNSPKDSTTESTPTDESPKDATTPRRSVRARKPRRLYSEELPVLAKATKKKSPKTKAKSPKNRSKSKPAEEPSEEDWIVATDVLFVNTEDKSAVTVKQIFLALEEQFQTKITKHWKGIVRNRLKALITGTVVPTTTQEDDNVSEQGEQDDEAQQSDSEPEESEDEADDEASAYSDSDQEQAPKKVKRKTVGKTTQTKQKLRRPKRSRATAKAAAKVMEAHRLRQQKRAQELKVRNEELQVHSKEDEERQEAIAAKFETNTDELRLKRLEERLDLLQKLDQTRISVVVVEDQETAKEEPPAVKEEETAKPTDAKVDGQADAGSDGDSDSDSESDESSSDEEDLVIVGMKKPFRPLKPLHNHLPSSSLQLLNTIRSPQRKQARKRAQSRQSSNNTILSPNKSMGARFALRNALKQKQRRQGNSWLARELGYKNEEDHLKDCLDVADQKRATIVQQEQERLKANERKQLRERLLLQEQQGFVEADADAKTANEDDPDDEAYVPPEEEEDEEMKLAKEIEQEAKEKNAEQVVNEEAPPTEDTPGEDTPSVDEQTAEESSPTVLEQGLETQPPLPVEPSIEEKPLSSDQPSAEQTSDKAPEEGTPNANTEADKSDEIIPTTNSGTEPEATTTEVQTTDVAPTTAPEESVVTPEKAATHSEDEGELEFDGNDNDEEPAPDPNRPRNAGWQAMLKREAEKLKQRKKRKGGLVEEEAEEEEEEEIAGLEDFGFSISKKKKSDDDENVDDELDADDLEHVVDDVSDGEGDEDAGRVARKKQEQLEEKARHKEILRRMREGYDGRRGGIAGGGAGARGMHRFDQLVAADNREDAKRLGLLNDDELDSEDEKEKNNDDDEEEDETALLDKMLKDRFLHRSSVDLEENFSEDEEEELEVVQEESGAPNDEEVRTQERLARRFAKRARMQRLEEQYGDSQEFSQQRLIDEDLSMKEELSKMRCGLLRRSSSLSRASSLSRSSSQTLSRHGSQSSLSGSKLPPLPRKRSFGSNESSRSTSGGMFQKTSGSLSIALRASKKRRTSFLGGKKAVDGKENSGTYKMPSMNPVLFNSQTSRSGFSNGKPSNKKGNLGSASLFSKVTN